MQAVWRSGGVAFKSEVCLVSRHGVAPDRRTGQDTKNCRVDHGAGYAPERFSL
jgi:hypothetical protein